MLIFFILHPSLSHDSLLLSRGCFPILVNNYFQVSANLKVILYVAKITRNVFLACWALLLVLKCIFLFLCCSFQVVKKMNLLVPIRSVSLARDNTHIFVCLQDGKLIVIGVERSWCHLVIKYHVTHVNTRDARWQGHHDWCRKLMTSATSPFFTWTRVKQNDKRKMARYHRISCDELRYSIKIGISSFK